MGYDDNTPLTGVTGGGLPAEIWRETMIRVHEGVPAKPLPMMEPDDAGKTREDTSAKSDSGTVGLIEGLLRDILGGGGGDRPPPPNVSGSDR